MNLLSFVDYLYRNEGNVINIRVHPSSERVTFHSDALKRDEPHKRRVKDLLNLALIKGTLGSSTRNAHAHSQSECGFGDQVRPSCMCVCVCVCV